MRLLDEVTKQVLGINTHMVAIAWGNAWVSKDRDIKQVENTEKSHILRSHQIGTGIFTLLVHRVVLFIL